MQSHESNSYIKLSEFLFPCDISSRIDDQSTTVIE